MVYFIIQIRFYIIEIILSWDFHPAFVRTFVTFFSFKNHSTLLPPLEVNLPQDCHDPVGLLLGGGCIDTPSANLPQGCHDPVGLLFGGGCIDTPPLHPAGVLTLLVGLVAHILVATRPKSFPPRLTG